MKTSRLLHFLFILQLSSFSLSFATPPPELTVLRQQYDKVVAERVTAPFDASLGELNTKYSAGLDRAIADAKAAGKLEDILAIEAEKKRLADKLPIPTTDDDKEPESLKKFRAIYRQQSDTLTATRDKAQTDLLAPYTAKLQSLEALLVKNDRVDEAKEVLAYRQGLGTNAPAAAAPATAASPATPPPAAAMPATDASKVKGDDRKAAEWILANWSEFRLFIDDHKGVSKAEGLPKGKFVIESIAIDGRFYTGTLTGESLQVLAGLQGLKTLTMGNFPDLKDEDLAFIGTLTGLEQLEFNKQNCTDAFLGYLQALKKLRKVVFGEVPNLTGIGFEKLVDLPLLDQIVHWKGGMTDEGIAAISKLPGITRLDFQSSSGVTNGCVPHLQKMSKLTVLYLSSTSITPEGFQGVVMPKITYGAANSLANLPLSELAPKFAVSFPNLEAYTLSYSANTPEDIAALSHYKKLKILSNAGLIKGEALPGLLELRNLEAYQVYLTEISPATWQTLAKMKKLKRIKLGSKPPDAASLVAFKKERPDVKLEP